MNYSTPQEAEKIKLSEMEITETKQLEHFQI